MSPITTHVLDLTSGQPAQGVTVRLSTQGEQGRWRDLALGETTADGRVSDLILDATLFKAGTYRMEFATSDYFEAQGCPTFYPSVIVTFVVDDLARHYHVPLLLSPYGYSTYRGS